jgi:hypothetical protein
MNWYDVQALKRLEERLTKLGYVMMTSRYGNGEIGVYPLEDKNPIYSRDAQLFGGTVEQIICWVTGIEHQNTYLMMLKATNDDKIKTLEEKYVKTRIQKGMLEKIKDPDKKLDKHTRDLIEMRAK